MAELCSALGDDGKRPRFIRTVFGYGYTFSATAEEDAAAASQRGPELRHLVSGRPAWIPLGTTADKQGKGAGANAARGRERSWARTSSSRRRLTGAVVTRIQAAARSPSC